VDFKLSDLFQNVSEKFDLILFNPPYLAVSEEDALGKAWSGGECGVEVIRRFLGEAARYLNPGGRIQLVASSVNNKLNLEKLFHREKFVYVLEESHNLFFEELLLYTIKRQEDMD
jgi:release factor glutamine methyltransferase